MKNRGDLVIEVELTLEIIEEVSLEAMKEGLTFDEMLVKLLQESLGKPNDDK